jgi:hypothetical protein
MSFVLLFFLGQLGPRYTTLTGLTHVTQQAQCVVVITLHGLKLSQLNTAATFVKRKSGLSIRVGHALPRSIATAIEIGNQNH